MSGDGFTSETPSAALAICHLAAIDEVSPSTRRNTSTAVCISSHVPIEIRACVFSSGGKSRATSTPSLAHASRNAFAGRRMFACAIDDGLAVRLSPDGVRRERARGVRPFAPGGRASRGWLFYRPARTGLEPGLVRVLEEAAAFAAARSVDEATVRRTPK